VPGVRGKSESWAQQSGQGLPGGLHGILALTIALVTFACSNSTGESEASISDVVPPESGVDYALQFDGTNDYATTGTAAFPKPIAPQTITLWVKIASTSSDQDWVTLRRDLDSGNRFGLAAGGLPTVWRVYGDSVLVQSSTPLEINRWQFIAYVFDGTQHAIYVDGALVGTGTTAPNNRSPTMGWLGTFDGILNHYDGVLDELRIWTVARTEAEILGDMTTGAPTTDTHLVAYYSFNEPGGQRVYDRSGNGNHASLGDGVADCMPARVVSGR
jgi:hypothetical protein